MRHKNQRPFLALAAIALGAFLTFLPHARSYSRPDADAQSETRSPRDDRLLLAIDREDVEWMDGKLFVGGKEREPGGSLSIWIFNVDSDERGITALFVQQSLKRLILGYGEDEVVSSRNETTSMQSLHKADSAGDPIHIHTTEAVYFGDKGCAFDLKYSFSDGTTTERSGLDFCKNVRNTSGTSGQVGFAVDGESVFDLESYLAASKSRPYWNRIKEHILKYWNKTK